MRSGVPHCLPNLKFYHQINPSYILAYFFFKIHLKIIILSTPKSPEWFMPFAIRAIISCAFFICLMNAKAPAHLILFEFNHHSNKWWSSNYATAATPFLIDPTILSSMFTDIFNLCPFLRLRDKVPHMKQPTLYICTPRESNGHFSSQELSSF